MTDPSTAAAAIEYFATDCILSLAFPRKLLRLLIPDPEDRFLEELVLRPLPQVRRERLGRERRDVPVEKRQVRPAIRAVAALLAVARAEPAEIGAGVLRARGLAVEIRMRRLDEHDQLRRSLHLPALPLRVKIFQHRDV